MNLRAVCLRVCLSLGAVLAVAGCKTVDDHGRYAVTAQKAPFYKYGPAQAFGADFALVKGQHVTMVERGFGFSRVLTEDGVSGFISTDDITAAPEPVPAAQPRVAARNKGSGNSGPRRKPAAQPEPDSGLFNFNDIPLPTEPELPKKDEVQPPKPDAAATAKPAETKPDPKPAAATPAPKTAAKKKRSA